MDAAFQLPDLLFEVDAPPGFQLPQMALRQLGQQRKDGCGSRGGAVEILVLDGCLDTRIGVRLHPLEHGEQPSEQIGKIAALSFSSTVKTSSGI